MSNRGRKGLRGNAQRGAGPRLSNAPGYAAYARAANSETPPPVEAVDPALDPALDPSRTSDATLPTDSVLPKAAVFEALGSSAEGANDDEPPPSSTRSRHAVIAQDAVVKGEEAKVADRPRADRPKRAERRSKDRGKGARSSASPPAPARGAARQAPVQGAPDPPPVSSGSSGGPSSADLAEKFFEEGVQSEHGNVTGKPHRDAVLIHEDEEPTDLKILHKMQPEVRARRAKYVRYVTVVSGGCILLALAGLVRHKIARGDQEVVARDMAAYAATHAPENAPPENAAPPAVAPAALSVPPAPLGNRDEVVPFTAIRRVTAEHMVRSKHTSAHTLVAIETDFENVERVRRSVKERFREEEGVSLTYLPFISRAVIDVLRDYPNLNSSVGDDALVIHRDINLGFAVDLNLEGLIVPVIHHADGQSLRGLTRSIADIAARARTRKLSADDISGGTFTITNPGGYGTTLTFPIIAQPQVAILSTDGIKRKPVVVTTSDGTEAIAIHSVGMLALSFDHRAVDGAYASAFLRDLAREIETRDWSAEL
jgi:2-oxoglutarate dehydrogenase E2 component (dihydrolipoamide succinyltransferase)